MDNVRFDTPAKRQCVFCGKEVGFNCIDAHTFDNRQLQVCRVCVNKISAHNASVEAVKETKKVKIKKRKIVPLKCNTAAGMATRVAITKVLKENPYPLSVKAVTHLMNGSITKHTVQTHLRLMAAKGIAIRTRELGTTTMLYQLKGGDTNENQEEDKKEVNRFNFFQS